MEHKKIHSEHGTVHYWIHRCEKPASSCIVFTHGLTANHSMFEKQTAFFQSDYTVLTWDVPLHGLSRPYQGFSYQQAALELKSILDAEQIQAAFFVGMSMGGYPCQMFAEQFPNRVIAFAALDTTPFGLKYYSKSDLWWLKQVEPMAKWIPNGLLRKSMAKSVSKTPYSYHKMLEMLEPLTKAQIVEQMGIAYGGFAEENREMDFPFPVLILLGSADKTGKVRQYCEAWAANTGYPLHIVKNAAHFSNGDNPEQVNAEIKAFFEETV